MWTVKNVGWVLRSGTRQGGVLLSGAASLYPTYQLLRISASQMQSRLPRRGKCVSEIFSILRARCCERTNRHSSTTRAANNRSPTLKIRQLAKYTSTGGWEHPTWILLA